MNKFKTLLEMSGSELEFNTVLANIQVAESEDDLAEVRDDIRSIEPAFRSVLWHHYGERADFVREVLGIEAEEEKMAGACRDHYTLKEVNFDNFMFGGVNLSREEEFDLNFTRDFNDMMVREMELNAVSDKHLLFLHTIKQLRVNAVKKKNYARFSFIIKWVFNNKTRYNFWELKHIFRSHKELKKMFFPNVPSAKKAA